MKAEEPIEQAFVKGAKSVPISFSRDFEGWTAAIAAGATLEELYKWDAGGYPLWFMARVIVWRSMIEAIELHKAAAAAPKVK